MNNVKSIEIVFDNMESARIEAENIGWLHIGDIKRCIQKIACNAINKMDSAEEVFIHLHAKANDVKLSTFCPDGRPSIFDRILNYPDITSIVFTYESGCTETIYTPLADDYDENMTNKFQTNAINEKTGDLFIVISEKETVTSYFEFEQENYCDECYSDYINEDVVLC